MALLWIESYLNNRQQYVQINDTKTKLCNQTCGVPQGSELGPKLFSPHINDIVSITK